MTIDQFYNLTWQEYNWMCEASGVKQELQWTHTREVLAMLYNANRKPNSAPKKGNELIPLSFDINEEIRPLTKEEQDEILKKFGIKNGQ